MTRSGTVQPFRLGYRPQLDGMRAFAVLAVMGFHASILGAQGGYLGVESFFVLSGFLITVLLTQERARSGRIQLGAFYARRALRLLPALFLFLSAATAYAVLRPNTPETEGFGRALAGTIGYVANWVMAFESDFHTRVLSHTWTLSVEEQFYLLWPLMLVMLLGRFGPRRACAVAAAGAAGLTLWRIVLYERGAALPRVSWALDTRAAALLLGAAMGLAATAGWLVLSRRVARLATVAGFLWLVVIFLSHRYGIAAISFYPGRQYVEGILATDVASALLLAGLLFDRDGPLGWLFATPPAVWIGKLSYSLYLWHPLVFIALTPDQTHLPAWFNQVVRVGVTLAFVCLSYYCVELPFLRRKKRFERRGDISEPAELVDAPVPSGAH